MKAALITASLFFAAVAQAAQPLPGRFDSYVLSMSYSNDFCVSHPAKAECMNHNNVGMTLHGLWPNPHHDFQHAYQYCAISEIEFGKDWCAGAFDVSRFMGPRERYLLFTVMPGVQSCLHNHEWYAHGTCSGMTVGRYFGDAIKLAQRFNWLHHFQSMIAASAGKMVTRAMLWQALRMDLGPSADRSVVIQCRLEPGTDPPMAKAYFSELHITLNRSTFMRFPSPESLGMSEPIPLPDGTLVKDPGSCPMTGIVISP